MNTPKTKFDAIKEVATWEALVACASACLRVAAETVVICGK